MLEGALGRNALFRIILENSAKKIEELLVEGRISGDDLLENSQSVIVQDVRS